MPDRPKTTFSGLAGLLVTSAGFWLMARGARRVVATP